MKPKQVQRQIKRAARGRQKAAAARYKIQKRFFLSLMTLLALVFVVGILLDPEAASVCVSGLGGTTFASMMAIGSVGDVSDNYTFGSNITYQVYLIDINQLDKSRSFPQPVNRQVGTIPMANGEYMQYFEAHTFPTYIGNAEKGDISTSGTNTFTMIMGGVRDKLLDFAEQHVGGKFIILFKEIESSQWEILGSNERPIILKSFEAKNDNDGRYVTYVFERNSVKQYNHYMGNIIVAPETIHPADATDLVITPSQGLYSIPDGTASTYTIATVSGITSSDKGRIITLKGTGTSNAATVKDNTTFILEDGVTWTAKAGSSIDFRVMDSSTLTEVPGSRVQTA